MSPVTLTALRVTLLAFGVFFLHYATLVFSVGEDHGWDFDDVMSFVGAGLAGLFAATTAFTV